MTNSGDDFQEALSFYHAGQFREAAQVYQKILERNPQDTEALFLLAVIAHQTGNYPQAVQMLCRVLELSPGDARCYNVAGLSLLEVGDDEQAEASFRQALAIEESPEYYNNLGTLQKRQKRLDEAKATYQRALELAPGYANAHYNLGNVYREQNQMALAAESFERAVAADAGHARALVALGQALQAVGRPEEAVPVLERALELIPDDAHLYCDLGDALQTLQKIPASIEQYEKAVDIEPGLGRAWYSCGCAESSQSQHSAAIFCFQKALEGDPGRAEAQHNLGHSFFKMGQVTEAMKLFRQAEASGDPREADAAIAVVIPGDPASSNADVLTARRRWAEQHLPAARGHSFLGHTGPLRVGYVSSFFQDHNWMKPVWGLIHQHDRKLVEVHLFSDAPASAIRQGYRSHPRDRFHDISGLPVESAAHRVEKAGIDVLVDLNGYSAMDRQPLFALRPAPLIAGWFNMYATTGMSCYDFLIGDDVVIPPEEEQFYTEPIVRVPGSYLTFEVGYPVPDVADAPCAAGGPVTFGCLAPQYKITPEVIRAWCAILQQLPDSTLLLKNSALRSGGNRQFVYDQFEACDVDPDRVRAEGPAEHYQFLETYGQIDIALDTFPYNGGTTTTEAIWQGVPVVTFKGDRWVSRTSASILTAGGLGEFVRNGVEDYVAFAVELAKSPERLVDLRRTMRERLLASPVCDTRRFARNMERLYGVGE